MIRISVPSNIDRPSIIIRRSKSYGDVYTSGTVVYSGDKKESHDDTSITEDGYYYYGIEFHNAGVRKVRTIPTGQMFIRDWGVLLPFAKSNIATYGVPIQAGANGNGVVIFEDGGSSVIPTYSTIYSRIVNIGTAALAEFNTTGSACKVSVANQSTTATQKVCAGVLDGKIVSIPNQSTSIIRMEGPQSRVGSGIVALAAYLDNNPADSEIVIGGYRWRIRIMNRELLTRFISYFRRIDANTSMTLGGFQIGSVASVLINDPEAAARNVSVMWTNNGGTNEFNEISAPSTNVSSHMFVYFEMMGPA